MRIAGEGSINAYSINKPCTNEAGYFVAHEETLSLSTRPIVVSVNVDPGR